MTDSGGNGVDDGTARRFAESLIDLFDDVRTRLAPTRSELVSMITEHIGRELLDVTSVNTKFERWEHVSLHLGAERYVTRHTPDAEWFGVGGAMHGHAELIDVLSMANRRDAMFTLGAVEHTTAATGPNEAMEVIQFGLVRTRSASGAPVVIGVRGPTDRTLEPRCVLSVLAADEATATEVRAEIEGLVREVDLYRGKVLSFDVSEYRGNELVSFVPRPELTAHDVVLPDGVLDSIERHVVRTAARTDLLRRHGQHLKRGVLLYGPPGTGKTHTVRYLLSRLTDATVVLLAGNALARLLPQAVGLARRLQPAVLVLEDIDLVAEDRSQTPGGTPVLFDLLNRIDGVASDADVTFVLTTNRVAAVERALTQRPGRVDLAVEIPRPDAQARERLLRLYAEGTDLDLPDASRLVAGTDGVTASFMRELVRRAVSSRLDELGDTDRLTLDEDALRIALEELQEQSNRLTRNIIGGGD